MSGTRTRRNSSASPAWVQLGARILAETGGDRARFADARALKSYAGAAPIARASGKKTYVGRRFIKNDRHMAAGLLWAFASLQGSERANEHYRRRRTVGDWHAAAQRNLFKRLLGQQNLFIHGLKAVG